MTIENMYQENPMKDKPLGLKIGIGCCSCLSMILTGIAILVGLWLVLKALMII